MSWLSAATKSSQPSWSKSPGAAKNTFCGNGVVGGVWKLPAAPGSVSWPVALEYTTPERDTQDVALPAQSEPNAELEKLVSAAVCEHVRSLPAPRAVAMAPGAVGSTTRTSVAMATSAGASKKNRRTAMVDLKV